MTFGNSSKRLFLLDGMALAYRAHFAFINRPIRNSAGMNTSAIFGFVGTLLDLLEKGEPTHIAIVFDTDAPTARHTEYEAYKANRQEMPEDLSLALPHLRRVAEAFNIPVLLKDGYEADDIIGTLARKAEQQGFDTYMVTPDKDFGQLVDEHTFIYRPSYKGDGAEIFGVKEVCDRWGIENVLQVIDILGLMGDTSDNIPGVPGIGPKTAEKLIRQFGSLEHLLDNLDQLKGKQKERLTEFAEQARLSKRLATIDCEVPLEIELESLLRQQPDEALTMGLFAEFEFRTLGKRIFGEQFSLSEASKHAPPPVEEGEAIQGELFASNANTLKTIHDVRPKYTICRTSEERQLLTQTLLKAKSFCFDTETNGFNPRSSKLVGLSFSNKAGTGWYIPVNQEYTGTPPELEDLRPAFENEKSEKVAHNLKFDLTVLQQHGVITRGKVFDTMLVHALVEPEQRHKMDYLAENYLQYSPIPIQRLIGEKGTEQRTMDEVPLEEIAEYAAEDADVTWQLKDVLAPMLKEKGQEKVYHEIEADLVGVLVDMELTGITLDSRILRSFSSDLESRIYDEEQAIFRLVGHEFNLNSPKQLGIVFFEELKLMEKPKKTKTGQYSTNEQVLTDLANKHEVVRRALDYRELVKLKNTYVDTLPNEINPATNRIHTNYTQLQTVTGRLASNSPNLQNIPIRTELGREIRKAFVARDENHVLLSADYSQIELRIIAALSQDPAMLEDFTTGKDIHSATAARIYGVTPEQVTREMRSKAKMVNFGIPYGISAFGLAQRLGASRTEASELIDSYFNRFTGIRDYIDKTLEFARKHGYAETVAGRRRYLPDIRSGNATTRAAAERNAINMPIQGTAADMIKLAMINIHKELNRRNLTAKLILQVHDELVLEVPRNELDEVRELVESLMRTALPLDCPIEVESGYGSNWLEAH